MLTKSGAKLLGFGLTKAHAAEAAAGMTSGTTKTASLTAEGTILDTLQYMAPEQLEGGQAGARTDVFALGAVIYEMATGKKAFEGKSQASLIAAILERDPPPVSTIQAVCPPALDHVVQRCLAKSPDARWQTARDLSFGLKWTVQGGSAATVISSGSGPRMRVIERLAWVAGAILLAFLAGWAVTRLYSPPQERAVRFELTGPVLHVDWMNPIVSPNGEYVAIPVVSRRLDSSHLSHSKTRPASTRQVQCGAGPFCPERGGQTLGQTPLVRRYVKRDWSQAGVCSERCRYARGQSARLHISNSGGVEPFWRSDSKELFYLNGNKLMAVDVNGAGETLQAGVPKELFEAPLVTEFRRNRYDVTRDGKRFLVIEPADQKQEQRRSRSS
jgi:hypothetical protein